MDKVHVDMVDEPTKEDLAILEEIQKEEAESDGQAPKEQKSEEKPNEAPPEPKKEEEAKPKKDDAEDGFEVVDNDDDDDPKPEDRRPKFVRLEKHKKLREKFKELEAEVERLKTTNTPTQQETVDLTKEIKAIAEEQGMEVTTVERLIKLAETGAYSRLKSELGDKFKAIEETNLKAKEAEEEAMLEKVWRKQLDGLLGKFPDEVEHIKSIEAKLKTLSFTDEYAKTPLDVIYRGVDGLRPVKRRTVESGRGGSGKDTKVMDFKRIIEENDQEAIQNMDSATFSEFEKFIEEHKL